jgi:hypothetical protein
VPTDDVLPAAKLVKAGVGESLGSSQSGFDPAKHAQVLLAGKGVDGRIARGQAGIDASFGPLNKDLVTAAKGEREGAAKEVLAVQAKLNEQSRLELDAAKDSASALAVEKAAYAKSQVAGQLAKAKYDQSLAEWSAMSVNPGRLFQSAGKGGQFQMGVAAFVHDFLGAKGIKTSAMDTLNRAIDRDIDAQIQNISKAGQVTQGFKTLWDMQRAESQSDTEARLRMRGFALETAKHEAAASLGVMDSKLAGSKLQRAQAEIDKERVKNSLAVEAQIQDGKNAVAQREVQRHGSELAAAATVRSAKYSYDANMAKITSDEKARASAAVAPRRIVVADLTASGDNTNKWYFKPEFEKSPEIQKETTDKLASVAKAAKAMDELMEIQSRLDGAPPGGKMWNELRGELARRESALRTDIVATRAYDRSGKALTTAEFAKQAEQVPGEGWFTNGETRTVIMSTLNRDIGDAQALVSNRLLDLTPDMPEYGTKAASSKFGAEEAIRSEIGKKGTPTPTKAMMSEAQLGRPDMGKPVEDLNRLQTENPALANAWSAYMQVRGPLTADDLVLRGISKGGAARYKEVEASGDDSEYPSPAYDPAVPDKGFQTLYELHQSAMQGDTNADQRIRAIANTSEGLSIGTPYENPFLTVSPQQKSLEQAAEWLLTLPRPPAGSN